MALADLIRFMELAVLAALAFAVWRRRSHPAAAPFLAMLAAAGGWLTVDGFVSAFGAWDVLAWRYARFHFVATLPPATLALALAYREGRPAFSWRRFWPVCVLPAITLAVIWTNASTGLFWNLPDGRPAAAVFEPLPAVRYGPWFTVHTVYSYALLGWASLLLAGTVVRSFSRHRAQAALLIAGILIPWLANIPEITGLVDLPTVGLTSMSFGLSTLFLGVGVFRFGLLDLAPVARAALVDGMSDGLVVFDAAGRLADINPVACRILGLKAGDLVGRLAAEAGTAWAGFADWAGGEGDRSGEEIVAVDGAERHFEVRSAPLMDRHGRPGGRMLVLHDITDRREAEAQGLVLREQAERRSAELNLLWAFTRSLNRVSTMAGTVRAGMQGIAALPGVECAALELNRGDGGRDLAAEQRPERAEPDSAWFSPPPAVTVRRELPLAVGEIDIGLLRLELADDPAEPRLSDEVLRAIADQFSAALGRARLFEDIQTLAVTDALTGLFNRRHFFAVARMAVEQAVRYGKPLAVLMVDVDHFKRVNDTHGHATGDKVLQGVAHQCQASLRKVDAVGRYGGEEFCVLLPETGHAGAALTAERLRRDIAALRFTAEAGEFGVTASIGVADLGGAPIPLQSDQLAILLDRADQALYAAKRGGRNRVISWTPDLAAKDDSACD